MQVHRHSKISYTCHWKLIHHSRLLLHDLEFIMRSMRFSQKLQDLILLSSIHLVQLTRVVLPRATFRGKEHLKMQMIILMLNYHTLDTCNAFSYFIPPTENTL